MLRVDEALDRLVERDAGGDEDREHDGEPGQLLAAEAAQEERDPERDRRQRVAEVVDQVGEQRDRTGQDEDRELKQRGDYQDGEADRDGLDAGARADDRAVDEPVRVAVAALGVIVSMLVALVMLVRMGVRRAQDASSIGSG